VEKIDILGTKIDALGLQESMKIILEGIETGQELRIVTANPELIYSAQKNRKLREIINTADLVLPDGIGVIWAACQFGYRLAERVTGIDLTLRLLEEGNQRRWRIFLLGARPGIPEKAVTKLYRVYPGVILSCHHGYFSQEEEPLVIEKIRKFAPDILLVGLGAPRQELFNAANRGLAMVRMGVGGSIDVLSGEVKRAPQFYRKHNLEWLYRLATNPSRIGRQAVLPLYVLRVLWKKYRQ
jgi:N-acetylglucosaminyldiphosphoundecaprenol N-acetyl-beta-D-mannosaminyltransferase